EHNVEYELLERLAVGDSNPFYRAVLRREAKLFRRYELELVRQVNDVRMISPRDAEVLAAAGVQPAPAVLAPFVDMDRYHCGRVEQVEPESLVCVGNMAWPPNTNGVQWFCEHVWPAVARANPRAKFYIVGKNPPPAIQRLAGENVIVTGYVDDERPYIHRAHLFVVPLLEGSGIRIKILTAMAMGRPVLSTSVGAEGISFSGLTLADSAEAWARAILEHLKQLPSVSHAAVEHIREHYDWRRTLRL
ncbi:MAG: glycosyltransferase, partial [bacterium]|nr:glycosyltransferase [bacterium]